MSKISSMKIQRYLCSILIATLVVFFAVNSHATAKPSHQLTYDVYAGGIHAMTADLEIARNPQTYKTSLKVATYGLLRKLANWHGEFGTNGWVVKQGQHAPEHHYSVAVWKGKEERKDYFYSKSGQFKVFKLTEAGIDKTPQDIAPEITQNTIDILSATLDVMADMNDGQLCNKTRTIFDGDRSFDAIFRYDTTENLKPTKYNIYSGRAVACTIEVKPKKGKWHQKPRGWMSIQEQGRKARTMPTIWFAKLNKDQSTPYMPVKIRVKTDYGTLFMHLTSYKDGGAKNVIRTNVKSKP